MIRNPSDGTVRETLRRWEAEAGVSPPVIKPVIDTETSGLPTEKTSEKRIAQLEASRDWLKEYFNRKEGIRQLNG